MPLNESRKCEGIFGTPVEPLFNNEENGTNSEILQDWLINMAVMNSETLKSKEISENIFNHGHWAQCIFLMCERFELPHQTKFAALDLFDRFMARHINDLYSHVQNSDSNKKKSDWTCILDRVKNQTFLRILSCCQIASKLTSHYKVITVKRARKCLLEAGYSYSNESIIQSEMRILKTLSYNVSRESCLDFIDILLEILGYNAGKDVLNVKVYHDTAIKILTLICLNRHQIYDRLYLNTARMYAGVLVSSQEQKRQLAVVTCDKMLLAVGTVAAAVHLNDDSLSHQIILQLHKISAVPVEDIQEFCKVIVMGLQDFVDQAETGSCLDESK
ncbi:hypothetical protein EGW08_001326 [Elysia chlorotica]|uniref:Cyclin N-terminal domain-containing protein n=1 Tax=Elysia chlorotica TaxID=188477 RepID=A0A3S1BTG8_ELYCH|nr:hypothetical protein EGW08_001326 [Elysia chlorotica]